MRRNWLWKTVLSCAALLLANGEAGAVSYGFYCITAGGPGPCAVGETQLLVDVTDPGGNQVLFTFSNSGLDPSSVTDVYFDDGGLLDIATIIDDPPMVEFTIPAIPGELPDGNTLIPPFQTTSGFSADSIAPPPWLGVDPGEELGLVFDLIMGETYADVISQLNNEVLRIGLRVQAFAGGESASFVNNIPEPGTAILLGLGLAGFAVRARRSC